MPWESILNLGTVLNSQRPAPSAAEWHGESVLIGTSALAHHLGPRGPRPADADFLTVNPRSLPPTYQGLPVDAINGEGIIDQYAFSGPVASIDEVYTLKVSHSPWVIPGNSWIKHIRHIRLLRDRGAVLIPELHDAAYARWEATKGAKTVHLNRDTEEFFSSGVRRVYDHDSVHRQLALSEYPAYFDILADGHDVMVDKAKFDALPYERKVEAVCEEVMVLSVERDLIPSGDPTPGEVVASYTAQLHMLITRYSKGWFPRFAIENYFECHRPPMDYWSRMRSGELLLKLS